LVEGNVLGGDSADTVEHFEQRTWAFGAVCDGRGRGDIRGLLGKRGAEQELLAG
jgi:hypothetical protein